ncbi:RHS repeat-associated core domain-containing protein [Chryseobacterium sp. Marseille-Q3244]|uniref:DUF6443 domain-containing protein n=1 Tax=Chryseobacterium sp. Marseille-Q3244 TaxID=2758092 RepID=UPI00202570AA|nr:RHS repeat-associated core domain-containing protein [Chryseobacterium sp. Marseille-Q3244]
MKNIYKTPICFAVYLSGITYLSAQTNTENYIKTTECLTEDCDQKKESIMYYDALGNQKASVLIGGGSTPNQSLATKFELDAFGRPFKTHLPGIVGTGANLPTAVDYTIYPENFTYYENKLESSPLNRLLLKAAPGDDWKLGSGHEVKYKYDANAANEVRMFKVTTQYTSATKIYEPSLINNYNGASFYEANTLYKTSVTDEDNKISYDFKDKEGKLILKRKISEGMSYDTYYIYDIYGNLTYVLPPKLSEIAENQALLIESMNELGYQYKYDSKNRLVEKRIPGKDWECTVYDNQDRVVGVQNNKLRINQQWLFTKYDKYGRAVIKGIITNGGSRSVVQSEISNMGSNNVERSDIGYTQDNVKIYYTSNGFGGEGSVVSANYYDDYPLTVPGGIPTDIQQQGVASGNTLKDFLTQSMIREIGTSNFKFKHIFYHNKRFLPIRDYDLNTLGGYTMIDTKLDFKGKANYVITKHKKNNSDTEIIINEKFTYDHYERLIEHTHQINNNPKEYLVRKKYDALGRLSEDQVGNSLPQPLQRVKYSYNIRGWLSGVNNIDDGNSGGSLYEDLFSYKLMYNKDGYGTNHYNGNVASTVWRFSNDNIMRGYMYEYDNINRLRDAISFNLSFGFNHAYNEQIKDYDKNGNITGIIRTGDYEVKNVNLIDDLTYVYKPNSNKLLKVIDESNQSGGFSDRTNTGDDYDYDDDGNLTKDLNKGITKIIYNYLNLPSEVVWNTTKKVIYSYDADGMKISKKVIEGNNVSETLYLDGFQYKNNVLQFFPTAKGYVNVNNGNTFNYVYNYEDYLGNVRLSYQKEADGSLKVLEMNNYYPFGLKHKGYNDLALGNPNYQYKFGGKELQEDGTYDFGARLYMPDLGRWGVIDPRSQYTHEAYSYVWNNPLSFADPTGMIGELSDWIKDGNGNYKWDPNVTGPGNTPDGWSYVGKTGHYRIDGATVYLTEGGGRFTDIDDIGLTGSKYAPWLAAGVATSEIGIGEAIFAAIAAWILIDKVAMPIYQGIQIDPMMHSSSTMNSESDTGDNKDVNGEDVPQERKGGGKNGQHKNQKAKQSAEQEYEQALGEYNRLKSKPNKTPQDKKDLKKAENQKNHWKKKADETGENHSQKAKGSN